MDVQIKLNDGTTRVIDIGSYNVQKLVEELNDSSKNYIAIGTGSKGIILQRYSVVRIEPTTVADEERKDEDESE